MVAYIIIKGLILFVVKTFLGFFLMDDQEFDAPHSFYNIGTITGSSFQIGLTFISEFISFQLSVFSPKFRHLLVINFSFSRTASNLAMKFYSPIRVSIWIELMTKFVAETRTEIFN